MKKHVVHESEIEEITRPGRTLKWMITPEGSGSRHLSSVLIRVPAGDTVRPAHAHPGGEELIYIIEGSGEVLIDGDISEVREDTAVLFPQGSVHMLRNTGDREMKVICFFAPPSDLSAYTYFEDVNFPE